MKYLVVAMAFGLSACGLAQNGSEPSQPDVLPADAVAAPPASEASANPDATLPPPVGLGSSLGTTVVSLGDPSIGGMWLKTPLVDFERPGQVRYRGVVVAVTLQPLDLEVGAGSQISVRAMQALGASLSDLVEVSVEAT